MADDVLLAVIALVMGFAIGWLTAWLIWRRWTETHAEHIRSLQAALRGKEVSLLDVRARLQQERARMERVRGRLSQDGEPVLSPVTPTRRQDYAAGQPAWAQRQQDGWVDALRVAVEEVAAGSRSQRTVLWEPGWGIGALQGRPAIETAAGGKQEMGGGESKDYVRRLPVSLNQSKQELLELNARLQELIRELEANAEYLHGRAGCGGHTILEFCKGE